MATSQAVPDDGDDRGPPVALVINGVCLACFGAAIMHLGLSFRVYSVWASFKHREQAGHDCRAEVVGRSVLKSRLAIERITV